MCFVKVPRSLFFEMPQRQFQTSPRSGLVEDRAETILDHVFRAANDFGDVTVPESIGNQGNDSLFLETNRAGHKLL